MDYTFIPVLYRVRWADASGYEDHEDYWSYQAALDHFQMICSNPAKQCWLMAMDPAMSGGYVLKQTLKRRAYGDTQPVTFIAIPSNP